MNKNQMIVELALKTKVLFWSGVLLGSISIGVLGYAVVRYAASLPVHFVPSYYCG